METSNPTPPPAGERMTELDAVISRVASRLGENGYLGLAGSLELAWKEQRICIDSLRASLADVYGYLSRLFELCAPQCKPLPDLIGLATQIDNYIAGLRASLAAAEGENQVLRKEFADCRELMETYRRIANSQPA